jgi:molybdopterin-guanine dinucleotide biosynthesis protein A
MTAYEPEGATGRSGSAGPQATPGADTGYDAVVLAGGAARRLGGADKPGVRVGGRALLNRVLAACAGATRTVVVAEPRSTARPVEWAREDPPGGGPVAALDAGLRHTTAPCVVVLSADLPFLEEGTVRRLLDTLRPGGTHGTPPAAAEGRPAHDGPAIRPDGVLLTDPDGRDQPLVAVYRADALRRELAVLAAAHGGLGGLPLRRLVASLDLTRISDPVASFDCDTWDDIAAARARIREHGHVLDEWISAVKDELGIDLDVDTDVLLDLARDAAHGVARPAAPLTTFLVGYAAARAGGGPEAVAEAARKAAALALRWADEDTPDPEPEADTASPGTPTTPAGATPAAPATEPDAG